MQWLAIRIVLGLAVVCGFASSAALAADGKTLPTLMIKGEVVSVDANDPTATLLKVKDRYGFETPILLTPETKITQGDAVQTVASLTSGVPVEVEYNFDITTAKRHAVSVKLAAAAQPAAAPEAPAAPAVPAETPAESATPAAAPQEPAAASAPSEPAPPAPVQP
jgi:hypothetical protein